MLNSNPRDRYVHTFLKLLLLCFHKVCALCITFAIWKTDIILVVVVMGIKLCGIVLVHQLWDTRVKIRVVFCIKYTVSVDDMLQS